MSVISIDKTKIRPERQCYITQVEAAEAGSYGNVVVVNAAGKVVLADGSAPATTTPHCGVVVGGRINTQASGDFIVGEMVDVVWFGRVFVPGATLDPTGNVFISDTAGAWDDAAGTNSRRLGNIESAEVFFVNPEQVAVATS